MVIKAETPANTTSPQAVCPFIGLASDPGSLLAYPARDNLCNNCHPALTPAFDHQDNFCLTNRYEACPAYQSGVLPLDARHIASNPIRKSSRKSQKVWLSLFVLVAIGMLILAGWFFFNSVNPSTQLPAPSVQVTIHPTQELSTAIEPTAEIPTQEATQPAVTPSPDVSASQLDVLRRLYVPIGPPDQQFVIHRILDGDNLDILLRRYGTTLEAIQAINPRLPLPIWIDFLVIFPYNNTNVAGLPYLKGVEITQESISIDDLALELGLDPSVIKSLNNCPNGCTLLKSDWILVPTEPYRP